MSAPILQRGDRIHLALPVPPMLTENEAEARGRKDANAIAAIYAEIGVSILAWSAHSKLDHPVIVAVFRDAAQMPHAPAVVNAKPLSGVGGSERSQTPDTATGHTGGGKQ